MKTSELIGPALDWAVAKCEGVFESGGSPHNEPLYLYQIGYSPSTDWSLAGPIIDREWIKLEPWPNESDENMGWAAAKFNFGKPIISFGPTPLIAAMRCYCCAKLGYEINIPEELLQCQSQKS